MKSFTKLTLSLLAILSWHYSSGQVSLTNEKPSVLIDFSQTVPGVSNGAYLGLGFSPNPISGQLNSNAWSLTGQISTLNFGETRITDRYARGTTAVAVDNSVEGIYSYIGAPGSLANPAFMIQPSQNDLTPGRVTLKIVNNGGSPITSLNISYDLFCRNDGSRGNLVEFHHSANNSTFTKVSGLDFKSNDIPFSVNWVKIGGTPSRSTVLTGLYILPGQEYFIRWSTNRDGGTGLTDDEIGLDDINITGTFAKTKMVYYSKPTGALNVLSTWGMNPDGTGLAPTSFLYNNTFYLANRSGAQTLTSEWQFGGHLLIQNNVVLASNGFLTLKSNESGTGSIGELAGTANVTGDVTVERFMNAEGNRAYRLICPSLNTTTSIRANWQEGVNLLSPWNIAGTNPNPGYGTHITGSSTGLNGFDATISGNNSLFTFDQVSANQQWVPIANTNTNTLNAKNAYLIFVRGDRSVILTSQVQQSTNTILRAKGTILKGNVVFSNLESNGRFSLITNPYPASIYWKEVYKNLKTTFEKAFYVWDPNIGTRGGFITIDDAGIKSNLSSKCTENIQSGQAFFVKALAGVINPSITVSENHKSHNNDLNVMRVGNREQFSIGLFYTGADSIRRNADGVMVKYDSSFSGKLDGDDIQDMANWEENMAVVRDGVRLSIEARPLITATDTIFIALDRLRQQPYELQFDAIDFSHPSLQAFVIDKYLATQTAIDLSATFNYKFNVTADPGSFASDRFSIVFKEVATLPVTITSVKAYQKGNDVQVEWTVENELNMDKYVIEHSADGRSFKAVGTQKALGSSANTYTFLHTNVGAGANYYRIKSVGK